MSPPCKLFRVYLSVCVVIVCLCVELLLDVIMYVCYVCVCVCVAQQKGYYTLIDRG